MTHVPICITGYRSLVALTHLSTVPRSYWLRFRSRQWYTTVTARANRRATHCSTHLQAYVYEHVHTKNIVLQTLAASRCDYSTMSLTNKLLYMRKLRNHKRLVKTGTANDQLAKLKKRHQPERSHVHIFTYKRHTSQVKGHRE
jgi:hypothetical protein